MKKYYLIALGAIGFSMMLNTASANDSAYYMYGNQLIPLQENDISIRKEVLTITEQSDIDAPRFAVDVDYTFYNPSEEKTILMGFEADIPYNGFEAIAEESPYMKDFSVNLNGENIPYQVKFVGEPLAINSDMTRVDMKKVAEVWDVNESDYRYAYYFKATFKHGENKLRHRYQFSSRDSTSYLIDLGYLLTPANRWANKQIDDFTLNINLILAKRVTIEPTFFDDVNDWQSDGKLIADGKNTFSSTGHRLIFKRKNFHPKGELRFYTPRIAYTVEDVFSGYCFDEYPAYFQATENNFRLIDACSKASTFELKVLRNLPFAKRGYVFKDKNVQRYYENNQPWYKANPSYRPDMSQLSEKEKAWVNYWKNPAISPLVSD